MKIIMYGTELCPDCVEAKYQLAKHSNIELEYRNITEQISTLKEFLAYRDHEAMFESMKENGKVGIPFFLLEDGSKTFELSDIIDISDNISERVVSQCSIDGKGNC